MMTSYMAAIKSLPKTEDGKQYCEKCGELIQHKIIVNGKEVIVGCVCKCREEELENKAKEQEQTEKERNRKICFMANKKLIDYRFNKAEQMENLQKAKNYCDNFQLFRSQGKGLLMLGDVGTGKTFLTACIANELIDRGYKVLVTSISTIVHRLESSFGGRQEYLDSFSQYDLLVLDDLDSERDSEYMREKVYQVINGRYLSGLPMIVTTNLTAREIKNPSDVAVERIYSRIVEMCHPVFFKGENKRSKIARDDYREVEAILRGEKNNV